MGNPTRCLRKRSDCASTGFTLFELIVALAIATIVMAIATPTTVAWLRDRGARNAADQLGIDLMRAKLLAIKENANCSVTINSPGPNQYTISLNGEVVDLGRYYGGVAFTNSPNPSSAVITFTPQGLCSTLPAEILLTNQNTSHIFRLRVSGAGGISEKRYNPGSGTWM